MNYFTHDSAVNGGNEVSNSSSATSALLTGVDGAVVEVEETDCCGTASDAGPAAVGRSGFFDFFFFAFRGS